MTMTLPPGGNSQQPVADDIIERIARRRGVPPAVLRQTWMSEGGGQTSGVPAGDGGKSVGPFQIQLPTLETANRVAGTNYSPADLNDYAKAADVAAITLASNYQQFGNWPAAAAAYMTGPTGLREGRVNSDVMGRASRVSQALGLDSDPVAVAQDLGVPNGYGILPPGMGGGWKPIRPDYSRFDPIMKQIEENERQQEQAMQPYVKSITEQYARDMPAVREAFDAAKPVDIKPWNQQPPKPDPIEGFASVAAVFAGIASAFTHTPAINAMNGMAAAINARKENDQKAYDEAYKAWQDNTKLAIDRQRIQSEAFKNALDLMKTNLSEGDAAMKATAAIYGARDHMLWAEAGEYGRIAEQNAAADRAAQSMERYMFNIEKGRFGNPVIVQTQGEDGTPQYSLGQQDKMTGQWVTADEKRDPITSVVGTMKADQIPAANDPSVKQTARGIAEYRLPMLSGFVMKTPWGQQVMADVLKINPDYRATRYAAMTSAQRAFASGREAQQTRAMNVAIAHLDTFEELAKALQTGDIQAINAAAQRVAQETGQPAPTSFDLAKQIVGEEIVKAIIAGGGGVTERASMAERLSRVQSPQQLQGAIDTARTLLAGQLGGLERQYEKQTKEKDFGDFLSPRAKQLLETRARLSEQAKPDGGVPTPPASLAGKDGLQWSPSRKQWRDSSGQMYDADGNLVQ